MMFLSGFSCARISSAQAAVTMRRLATMARALLPLLLWLPGWAEAGPVVTPVQSTLRQAFYTAASSSACGFRYYQRR